jgi:type IV pilus assembly protein PilA
MGGRFWAGVGQCKCRFLSPSIVIAIIEGENSLIYRSLAGRKRVARYLLSAAPVRAGKQSKRGFTLVELMVTVVIVGILATLAVYGVGKYIRSAQSSEAIQMIGSIKTCQESYKAEMLAYLDVSGTRSLAAGSYYPSNNVSQKEWGWGDTSTVVGQNFARLGVVTNNPVRFAYASAAGGSSDTPVGSNLPKTTVTNWPAAPTGAPWYVVAAKGDLDGDGKISAYASGSFTGQIFIDDEGE